MSGVREFNGRKSGRKDFNEGYQGERISGKNIRGERISRGESGGYSGNVATGDSGRKLIRYSNVELKFWLPLQSSSSNLDVY
jgi:hypothetical protein